MTRYRDKEVKFQKKNSRIETLSGHWCIVVTISERDNAIINTCVLKIYETKMFESEHKYLNSFNTSVLKIYETKIFKLNTNSFKQVITKM